MPKPESRLSWEELRKLVATVDSGKAFAVGVRRITANTLIDTVLNKDANRRRVYDAAVAAGESKYDALRKAYDDSPEAIRLLQQHGENYIISRAEHYGDPANAIRATPEDAAASVRSIPDTDALSDDEIVTFLDRTTANWSQFMKPDERVRVAEAAISRLEDSTAKAFIEGIREDKNRMSKYKEALRRGHSEFDSALAASTDFPGVQAMIRRYGEAKTRAVITADRKDK